MSKSNLDERIKNCVERSNPEYFDTDEAKELVKQLLRDVLEYVKPEYQPDSSATLAGYNVAVEDMEAKTKELGL